MGACQKCKKMIYRKLMIIGSNVTVGWQLVPQGNSVYLGAFGKMSGSHCRRFRPSPHPLPQLLVLPLFRSFPPVREHLEKLGKGKETAATQATEHSFNARSCWCNLARAQGFQKTNFPSTERSFYLLNPALSVLFFSIIACGVLMALVFYYDML